MLTLTLFSFLHIFRLLVFAVWLELDSKAAKFSKKIIVMVQTRASKVKLSCLKITLQDTQRIKM